MFQPLPTGDFQQIVADVEETVRGTGQETGTKVETHDDEFSYRWMVLRDDELEDLAVGINAVSDALAINGYKDRVLCAVFALQGLDRQAAVLHLQLQARLLVPVRAGPRRQAALDRARAAGQGDHRQGAADRARPRALVPALGDPDLGAPRAEGLHLVAVPADLHVAPGAAAVARRVVERPAAGVATRTP